MPLFAVFGNPIAHSVSPQMHTQFAQQFGIAIDYQKREIPLQEFTETITAFRTENPSGANITMPFKIDAYHYADQHTDRAAATHTVNTFIFKDDHCVGDNTDGIGLIRDLKENLHVSLQHKTILIIGAGGATRAILHELILQNPKKIYLHNRTRENAQDIIHFFQTPFAIELYDGNKQVDLVINAATIDFQKDAPCHFNLSNTVCYDLNYGKRHNTFSQWAKENHAAAVYDGLGMLVEQGAESFYQWLGKRPKTHAVISYLRQHT